MMDFFKRDIGKEIERLTEQHQQLESQTLQAQDFARGLQRLLNEANRKITYIQVKVDAMEPPSPQRPQERLLRLPEVMEQTGLNRNKVYASKDFPRPIKIGPRTSAWVESEVQEWIYSQIEEQRAISNRRKK